MRSKQIGMNKLAINIGNEQLQIKIEMKKVIITARIYEMTMNILGINILYNQYAEDKLFENK